MSRLKADDMFTNFVNLMFSNQAIQGNTALKVHHHSDSDYNTGVPFALSNGGVYDVPMKFARKLIHGGPVHFCYEPMGALQQCMVLSECMLGRWFYLHG